MGITYQQASGDKTKVGEAVDIPGDADMTLEEYRRRRRSQDFWSVRGDEIDEVKKEPVWKEQLRSPRGFEFDSSGNLKNAQWQINQRTYRMQQERKDAATFGEGNEEADGVDAEIEAPRECLPRCVCCSNSPYGAGTPARYICRRCGMRPLCSEFV